MIFIPSFSTDALGASAELSSYMLVIANAGTFFGRLVPADVAQWIGAMNTVIGITLIVAIINFCWIAVHSIAGMVRGRSSGALSQGGSLRLIQWLLRIRSCHHPLPSLERGSAWHGLLRVSVY